MTLETMYGFIICQPYAGQIINGEKKQEFRSRRTTKLNIPVYLLSNKKCLGIIQFTKCSKTNKHPKYDWAWDVIVIEKFTKPKKFFHPRGAQRWIKDVKFI